MKELLKILLNEIHQLTKQPSVLVDLKYLPRNKDADVENGLEDMGRGKGKLERSERVAWTYIHYQT